MTTATTSGRPDTSPRYQPIPIAIGGRSFLLRFTWGRLRRVRDLTDGRVDVIVRGIVGTTVDDLPLFVWAGITHKGEGGDPSLTLEQVHEMLDEADIRELHDLDRAVFEGLGIDYLALRDVVEEMSSGAAKEGEEADPLGAGAASPTHTSPSGENPSPSSASPPATSGTSHLENMSPSEMLTSASETTPSDALTTG